MNGSESQRSDDATEETLVNYMPGMPSPSTQPGRVERFLASLFRRRGALRPVVSERHDGE